MTKPKPATAGSYPKQHLLAVSGIAAILSLTFIIFPSTEVEAKKTYLNLDFDTSYVEKPYTALNPVDGVSELKLNPFTDRLEVSRYQPTDNAFSLAAELAASENEKKSGPSTQTITVNSGDTLSSIFANLGLSSNALNQLLREDKQAQRFTKLKVGQTLSVQLDEQGQLLSMSTDVSRLESIYIEREAAAEKYKFKSEKLVPTIEQAVATGTVKTSLNAAARTAGLPQKVATELSNIFRYDVDFAKDIRAGDSFELVYEKHTLDGELISTGKILAARFTNRGKTYTAVRYAQGDGQAAYYTADGKSMRKAFIRTPVEFARISSRFNPGRKHPILNKIRAHNGVDYAAPRGTPIKATGDGIITHAGRRGGYGNTVIIKHGQSYQTLYAHMHGFAKGITNGSRVRQGQIIGYVGTTGLSTGPHLHYEFQVNGVHVDPLSQRLPTADPLTGKEKQRFLSMTQPLFAKIDQHKDTLLAKK